MVLVALDWKICSNPSIPFNNFLTNIFLNFEMCNDKADIVQWLEFCLQLIVGCKGLCIFFLIKTRMNFLIKTRIILTINFSWHIYHVSVAAFDNWQVNRTVPHSNEKQRCFFCAFHQTNAAKRISMQHCIKYNIGFFNHRHVWNGGVDKQDL